MSYRTLEYATYAVVIVLSMRNAYIKAFNTFQCLNRKRKISETDLYCDYHGIAWWE